MLAIAACHCAMRSALGVAVGMLGRAGGDGAADAEVASAAVGAEGQRKGETTHEMPQSGMG